MKEWGKHDRTSFLDSAIDRDSRVLMLDLGIIIHDYLGGNSE